MESANAGMTAATRQAIRDVLEKNFIGVVMVHGGGAKGSPAGMLEAPLRHGCENHGIKIIAVYWFVIALGCT